MSTQAYYKERLGFDPADTVAEHHREQRSQHGYEESLSKFKGQNGDYSASSGSPLLSGAVEEPAPSVATRACADSESEEGARACADTEGDGDTETSSGRMTGSSQAFWGCWAKFIEAHGRSR